MVWWCVTISCSCGPLGSKRFLHHRNCFYRLVVNFRQKDPRDDSFYIGKTSSVYLLRSSMYHVYFHCQILLVFGSGLFSLSESFHIKIPTIRYHEVQLICVGSGSQLGLIVDISDIYTLELPPPSQDAGYPAK